MTENNSCKKYIIRRIEDGAYFTNTGYWEDKLRLARVYSAIGYAKSSMSQGYYPPKFEWEIVECSFEIGDVVE